MKILFTTLALTFCLTNSFAQTSADALPSSLASTMKAMSNDLKAIAAQLNNPQANSASATLADQFTQLVLHAKDFTPDSIAALPENQQAAAKNQYDSMLEQTAALGRQLAAALRANDGAQVKNVLNQLLQSKKDGHDQFNP